MLLETLGSLTEDEDVSRCNDNNWQHTENASNDKGQTVDVCKCWAFDGNSSKQSSFKLHSLSESCQQQGNLFQWCSVKKS